MSHTSLTNEEISALLQLKAEKEARKKYNKTYYETKRKAKRQAASEEKKRLKEEKKRQEEEQKRKEQEQKKKDEYLLKEINSLSTVKQELLYTVLHYMKNPPKINVNDDIELFKQNKSILNALQTLAIYKKPIPSFIEEEKPKEKEEEEDPKEKEEEKPVEEYKPIILTEKMQEDKDNLETTNTINIEDNMYLDKDNDIVLFKNKDVESFNNKLDDEYEKFINKKPNNNTSSNNNIFEFINNLDNIDNNTKTTEEIEYKQLYYNTIEIIKKINDIEGIKKPLELIKDIRHFNANIDKYENYNIDNIEYLNTLINSINNTIDNFNNN